MITSRLLGLTVARLAGGLFFMCAAQAVELGPLAIHGALSTTFAYSDKYNYLGDTHNRLDLASTELIVNGAHQFDNGIGVFAQLYAYELSNYRRLTLDFATVNYAINPQLGIRLGRNKTSFGLYGDSQDIDILRPFAFLPFDTYSKTFRPLNAAFDGASLYGQLNFRQAGSLDYKINFGWTPKIDTKSPFIRAVSDSSLNTVNEESRGKVQNFAFSWNTPLEGLRAVYSYQRAADFKLKTTIHFAAEQAVVSTDLRALPLLFPPGVWDFLLGGKPGSTTLSVALHTFSLEYTKGDWVLAAEYFRQTADIDGQYPLPIGHISIVAPSEAYQALATWQATKRLQFGTYYAENFTDRNDHHGRTLQAVPRHTAYLKDFDISVSYRLTPWWLIKAEVHDLYGTDNLTPALNGDAANWSPHWKYLVLKSTFSF